MKVKVLIPFFDDNGLHMRDEVVDVPERAFDENRMEQIEEEKKEEKKVVKTAAKVKK